MTRPFCDLHLRANPKDTQTAKRLIAKAAGLGYRHVSVQFAGGVEEEDVASLKAACNQAGVDFVLRADYQPRNQEDVTRFLRRFRRRFEVVCIVCGSKEVARQAAKDRRVDLLSFPSLDYRKRFFDRAEAELACNSLAAFEVDLKPLLALDGPARARLLSNLRREVSVAREFHVPVVVSSGAGEERFMRAPRDMAAIAFLFGMDEAAALDAVSSVPAGIVRRNREKMDEKFVAPGIRVLKEGKPQ